MTDLRIAVYCGSSSGTDPAFRQTAAALGHEIVQANADLVYGGGNVGLMGVVANEVLAGGRSVTGVMTQHLVDLEVAHPGLTTLEVRPTMQERKARMAELADAVIVLPGGYGTLDEAFEVLTWNQLGLAAMPVVFLDAAHYFEPLFQFIKGSAQSGFMKDSHAQLAQHTDSPATAVRLAAQPAAPYEPKWIDRSSPADDATAP